MTEWKKSVDSERGSWKRFCPLPGKFSTGAHDSIVQTLVVVTADYLPASGPCKDDSFSSYRRLRRRPPCPVHAADSSAYRRRCRFQFDPLQHCHTVYTEWYKKVSQQVVAITASNVDRLSKLFHQHNQQERLCIGRQYGSAWTAPGRTDRRTHREHS